VIKRIFLSLFILQSSLVFSQELRVTTNFESGSARVLFLDQQTRTIRITPAGDAKRGMPNWWYLRIDGINTELPLVLEVEAREDLIRDELTGQSKKTSPGFTWPARAAISVDSKIWRQTTEGQKIGNRMVYQVQPTAGTLWLAWGPPFTPTDAQNFVNRISQTFSFAEAFTLSLSVEGRSVPALQIAEGSKPANQRPAVWISARHHAWECGGSWVGAGLTEWLVSDNPQAKWFRQHAEIFVVPLLDVDHVASGDGGKHCEPQDHNLDWSEKPHWPEVAAAQKRILALAKEGRMSIFLDLHNPAPGNKQQTAYVIEKAYMPAEADARKLRFVQLMIEEFGGLKQNPAWPPVENPDLFHRVSVPWVLEHSNVNTIAFCIETPWNTPSATPEGYGIVGQKLGSAIEKLLKGEEEQQ
jgi:hypothetical protein